MSQYRELFASLPELQQLSPQKCSMHFIRSHPLENGLIQNTSKINCIASNTWCLDKNKKSESDK